MANCQSIFHLTHVPLNLSHGTSLEVTDPILQQTEYHFFSREDVSLHTDIGKVAANRDPSTVTNSSFLYSVADSEPIFQLDVSTGALSNKDNPFDFETGENCDTK